MNIATVTQSIAVLPELVRSTVDFAKWRHGNLLSILNDPNEEGEDEEETEPFTPHAAGRIALEFVMTGRITQNDPKEFRSLMEEVLEEVDSPQHAVDIIMSLAGMVNALAEDEDLAHFGEHILANEVRAS
jgi:hypothetical protein